MISIKTLYGYSFDDENFRIIVWTVAAFTEFIRFGDLRHYFISLPEKEYTGGTENKLNKEIIANISA